MNSEAAFARIHNAESRLLNLFTMVAIDGSSVGAARHEARELVAEIVDAMAEVPATTSGELWPNDPTNLAAVYWRKLLDDVMGEIAQYHDISIKQVGKRPAWIKATEARTAAPSK